MLTSIQDQVEDCTPQLNTTPLIDVMLVLLIMFMLTLPVMTHSVSLNLGQGPNHRQAKPPVAEIEVDFDGSLYWNQQRILLADVEGLTKAMLARSDKAEFHVRVARLVRFDHVAKLLAEAERNGARRIAFVGNERFLE